MLETRSFAGFALAVVLAGCGGGGSDAPAPATTFEIAAAVSELTTGPDNTFDLGGSMMGQPMSMHAVHSAMPDGVFSTFGSLGRMRRTATFSGGGASETAYEDDYIDREARMLYGMIDSDGNSAVSTSRTPYPATASVGASGPLYEAGVFDSMSVQQGRLNVSWSLEAMAGDAGQAWLCINTQFQTISGSPTGDYEHDCYRIDAAGRVLGMRMTLTSNAFGTVVFQ
jgi:hypothetical protein